MRTIWNGVIKLGASQIPVGLAATRESGDPDFRTLHRRCLTPVRQPRVCPTHGALGEGETVKGWEIAPGEFVAVEDAELEAAAILPGSRQVELLGTVSAGSIDPLAIDRPYFLVPSSASIGHEPYAAFADAVRTSNAAVICRFYAWGKEQLAAISACGNGRTLILQTLVWAEDVRTSDVDETLRSVAVRRQDAAEAKRALAALKGKAKLQRLSSAQRPAVRALLQKKLRKAKRSAKPVAKAGKAIRA